MHQYRGNNMFIEVTRLRHSVWDTTLPMLKILNFKKL